MKYDFHITLKPPSESRSPSESKGVGEGVMERDSASLRYRDTEAGGGAPDVLGKYSGLDTISTPIRPLAFIWNSNGLIIITQEAKLWSHFRHLNQQQRTQIKTLGLKTPKKCTTVELFHSCGGKIDFILRTLKVWKVVASTFNSAHFAHTSWTNQRFAFYRLKIDNFCWNLKSDNIIIVLN